MLAIALRGNLTTPWDTLDGSGTLVSTCRILILSSLDKSNKHESTFVGLLSR